MSIPKRNIIIAGLAAAAVLSVVVAVVVIALTGSGSGQAIFKRCDGRIDPIQETKISSCPDSAKAGYCEIKRSSDTNITLVFTASKCVDNSEYFYL